MTYFFVVFFHVEIVDDDKKCCFISASHFYMMIREVERENKKFHSISSERGFRMSKFSLWNFITKKNFRSFPTHLSFKSVHCAFIYENLLLLLLLWFDSYLQLVGCWLWRLHEFPFLTALGALLLVGKSLMCGKYSNMNNNFSVSLR